MFNGKGIPVISESCDVHQMSKYANEMFVRGITPGGVLRVSFVPNLDRSRGVEHHGKERLQREVSRIACQDRCGLFLSCPDQLELRESALFV